MKFWVGQSISVFGSQFSGIAIPYAAYVILKANAFQFGLLGLLGNLAFLLLSLHVGVWVDRHRRKAIMVYSDLGRALILSLVPVGALLGFLSMNLFYVVALSAGILTVFFEISYQSYVPVIVEREKLVDANGKLETTRAIAQGFGPALAGFVINFVYPPLAVLGDTLGYFTSAGSLSWIRKAEEKVAKTSRSTLQDIREGLKVVLGDRRLWQIAACTGTANLFSSAIFTILIPYLVQQFSLSALLIGLVFSTGAVGSVLGGLFSSRLSEKLGVGHSIAVSAFMFGLPSAGFYLATGQLAVITIGASIFITGMGAVMYNVTQVSYRQSLVPRDLLGRMNATMRFIVTGATPIGSLLGGVLGQVFGYHQAIGIAVVGTSVAFLWIVFSPVRHVHDMPTLS
jgi:MFS family permease